MMRATSRKFETINFSPITEEMSKQASGRTSLALNSFVDDRGVPLFTNFDAECFHTNTKLDID